MRSQSYTATARWFDGVENRPQEVRVRLSRHHLEFMPWPPRPQASSSMPPSEAELAASRPSLPGLRRYTRKGLSVGEWWRGSPTPVGLPDGGTLWIPADNAMGRALGGQSLTTQLISSWAMSLCCLIALVALVAWFDRQGAGLLARAALPLVPKQLDIAVGDKVEQEVTARWLKPSTVAPARQAALRQRFEEIAGRAFPGQTFKLRFARLRDSGGFNAFALPNGTLFLLDGMTQDLSDDEVMAVLGHEAGHVKHRHAMRHLVQGVGLVAVAGVVMGDFSTVAASSMASVQTLRYGRNAEREADAEAQRLILREHLPNETLVGVWLKLRDAMRREGHTSEGVEWLSSHPPISERLESARRAAQNADPVR